MASKSYKRPELDLREQEFIGEWCVSTVQLSVEHHGGMWYETYIFPADGKEITEWLESWGIRYKTRPEAVAGHARITAALRAGTAVDDLTSYLDSRSE